MNGMAEAHADGASRRLRDALRIGNTYTIFDIAPLIGVNPVALRQTGVFRKSGSDAFIILVTLNKRSDATQYADALNEESSLLFWEGQTSMRTAEDSFRKGLDCYAFVTGPGFIETLRLYWNQYRFQGLLSVRMCRG